MLRIVIEVVGDPTGPVRLETGAAEPDAAREAEAPRSAGAAPDYAASVDPSPAAAESWSPPAATDAGPAPMALVDPQTQHADESRPAASGPGVGYAGSSLALQEGSPKASGKKRKK